MSWYWKRNPTWRKDLTVILGLCFLLTDWLSFGEGGQREGGSFEIGRPSSRMWKNFGRRWTWGMGGLENWTIFIDVISLSSLLWITFLIPSLYILEKNLFLSIYSKFFCRKFVIFNITTDFPKKLPLFYLKTFHHILLAFSLFPLVFFFLATFSLSLSYVTLLLLFVLGLLSAVICWQCCMFLVVKSYDLSDIILISFRKDALLVCYRLL